MQLHLACSSCIASTASTLTSSQSRGCCSDVGPRKTSLAHHEMGVTIPVYKYSRMKPMTSSTAQEQAAAFIYHAADGLSNETGRRLVQSSGRCAYGIEPSVALTVLFVDTRIVVSESDCAPYLLICMQSAVRVSFDVTACYISDELAMLGKYATGRLPLFAVLSRSTSRRRMRFGR